VFGAYLSRSDRSRAKSSARDMRVSNDAASQIARSHSPDSKTARTNTPTRNGESTNRTTGVTPRDYCGVADVPGDDLAAEDVEDS
jgi:hypothetical protein